MKLIPLAFTLLCITTQLHAQEKFIEVTVSDTVLAQAQTFLYVLTGTTANDEYFPRSRSNPEQAMEQESRRTKRYLDSTVQVLRQKGFHLLPLLAQDTFMTISTSNQTFSRRFLVHTLDSLSQLYQMIKNNKHVYASVGVSVADDESTYQQALWKKLIAGAKDKAEHIAASTNHRTTGILSVIEKPEDKITAGSGWTSYPPLSRAYEMPGWHTTIGPSEVEILTSTWPINTLYPIKGTFVVRFSVE